MTAGVSPRAKNLWWLCLSGALAAADLAIKRIAGASDLTRAPIELTPFFNLVYAQNAGAAFGIFADGGAAARWGLSALAVVVCGFVLRFLALAQSTAERLACASILGGAAGNLIERVGRGAVTDYIDWHVGGWHWPAFNLADAAISGGLILLLGLWLTEKKIRT